MAELWFWFVAFFAERFQLHFAGRRSAGHRVRLVRRGDAFLKAIADAGLRAQVIETPCAMRECHAALARIEARLFLL